MRLRIDKRIPVAAGMAGGSADAGAALRLVARAAGIDDDALLREIAAGLGADVAAQVRPRRYLATGAGERLDAAAPAGALRRARDPVARTSCRPPTSTARPIARACRATRPTSPPGCARSPPRPPTCPTS